MINRPAAGNRVSLCCHSGKRAGLIRNPDSRSPIGIEDRLRGNDRNVARDGISDPVQESGMHDRSMLL